MIFDLGSGAFANLRQFVDYHRIDAVIVTHMHADHFLDIVPLRYALKYGSLRRHGKLDLYLPPSGEAMLRTLVSAFAPEGPSDFLDEVFNIRIYDEKTPVEIKGLKLSFSRTVHYIETFAVRAELSNTSMIYSADTAPSEDVVKLAKGCNLFLCESTLGPYETEAGMRGHCSAREAALMAREAGVEQLVLTHYGSGIPPDALAEEARRHFSGDCGVADDFLQLVVG
ncbi:MAG: MBL fold metallo-hydrolase [Candidatus Eremiobacteraeota bacterium]|nr:MBL fold metallo-hydrolase [Candidatus Eremiobacteraeota bacterium]